jgi:lysophospholipase L1-like esterase
MDGTEWLGQADAGHLPDGLHPNAEGYELMAERFVEIGITPLRTQGFI